MRKRTDSDDSNETIEPTSVVIRAKEKQKNNGTHDDEIVDWTAIPPRDYEASTQACLLYRTGWILSVPAIVILQLINWRYLNNGIILLDSELHFARSLTAPQSDFNKLIYGSTLTTVFHDDELSHAMIQAAYSNTSFSSSTTIPLHLGSGASYHDVNTLFIALPFLLLSLARCHNLINHQVNRALQTALLLPLINLLNIPVTILSNAFLSALATQADNEIRFDNTVNPLNQFIKSLPIDTAAFKTDTMIQVAKECHCVDTTLTANHIIKNASIFNHTNLASNQLSNHSNHSHPNTMPLNCSAPLPMSGFANTTGISPSTAGLVYISSSIAFSAISLPLFLYSLKRCLQGTPANWIIRLLHSKPAIPMSLGLGLALAMQSNMNTLSLISLISVSGLFNINPYHKDGTKHTILATYFTVTGAMFGNCINRLISNPYDNPEQRSQAYNDMIALVFSYAFQAVWNYPAARIINHCERPLKSKPWVGFAAVSALTLLPLLITLLANVLQQDACDTTPPFHNNTNMTNLSDVSRSAPYPQNH